MARIVFKHLLTFACLRPARLVAILITSEFNLKKNV